MRTNADGHEVQQFRLITILFLMIINCGLYPSPCYAIFVPWWSHWFREESCICIGSASVPSYDDDGNVFVHEDIGPVRLPGTATQDLHDNAITISGSGADVWGSRDECHYLWRPMGGNFILQCRAEFTGPGKDPHRKMGIMVRATHFDNSPYVGLVVHGNGQTALQFRRAEGGATEEIVSSDNAPDLIQLERNGSTFIVATARFGQPFTQVVLKDIEFEYIVTAGFFVCSHTSDGIESAKFRNIQLTTIASPSFRPGQDLIGGRLETVDVRTGHRHIIFDEQIAIHSPNWARGTKSIYCGSPQGLIRLTPEAEVTGTFLPIQRLSKENYFPLDTGLGSNLRDGEALLISSLRGWGFVVPGRVKDDSLTSDPPDDRVEGNQTGGIESIGVTVGAQEFDKNGSPIADQPATIERKLLVNGVEVVPSIDKDHVLSWDGSQLAIAYRSSRPSQSSGIYIVPSSGGKPRQIISRANARVHAWSPDGKYLLYTDEQDQVTDIYRIGIDGGEVTRMTDAAGHDDTPEYSPDSRTIFFTSERSGKMQISRMDADGRNRQTLTQDDFQNWSPHVSPDGTQLVFLSYLPDEKSKERPYYRQVYIRLMPVTGGVPRVVAYVYGGRGTIDRPSWSPDGNQIAFISNSDMLSSFDVRDVLDLFGAEPRGFLGFP